VIESHFLWPKSKILDALISAPKFIPIARIEDELTSLFPGGYPVLCSSGRVGLVLALIESGMARESLIGMFPYASHCVLDAVSRVATPLSGSMAKTASLRVVYHQWGYVQETELPSNTIEDCVDTLCIPGTKLFPAGGQFEIWSLPKIVGTSSGGVLWCREKATALKIRKLRAQRGGGTLQWLMRLLTILYPKTYHYWQGAEGSLGNVSRLQTGEILTAVRKWERHVTDRISKLKLVSPLAVNWLPFSQNRLPSVVPIENDLPETVIQSLGIASGYRIMERFIGNKSDLVKVLPIPIHQGTSIVWLENILKQLNTHQLNKSKIECI
jgi:putative PLP-dependent aminotransferase (TIGR04422 family)